MAVIIYLFIYESEFSFVSATGYQQLNNTSCAGESTRASVIASQVHFQNNQSMNQHAITVERRSLALFQLKCKIHRH